MDLSNLNQKQREAVISIGGPMLVFAGAGSGKTRVLTYKIAYLIQEIGLDPKNILAVTFTNKAAQEMKSRVHDLIDVPIDGISIGTFHSIGANILRKEIKILGYENNFSIYDQTDSRSLIKTIIKDLDLDLKMYDPKTAQIRISQAKNNMQSPDELLSSSYNRIEERYAEIYKIYVNRLKENNSVDFDDLLVLPIKIFQESEEKLIKYQDKFKYVLVDEYQDTNKPQFELIYSLTKIHNDIFVVGDDDQSIYGWRGADISNILNFNEAFDNSKVVKLEQNYRSTQNILSAAWSVVSKNSQRSDKQLWTENEKGDLISILESFNERSESSKILKNFLEIKKNNQDSKNSDFVVLYRTNAQSRVIEDEFRKAGIPYQIIGGVKFYDRKEVKDLIAYMRLIVNHNDSVSFDRIINFPPRGIGKTTLNKIHNLLDDKKILDVISDLSLLDVGKKQKKSINDFYNLIRLYSDKSKNQSPSLLINDLIHDLGLKEYYMNQNTTESNDRWLNIEECINSIADYESLNKDTKLSDYLQEVSLLTDIDSWNKQDDVLMMMTIHSAKGLEFPYVFVGGMEEGLFPIVRPFEDGDIEEERRLFYVALTRAHKKVFLSYAKSRRKFGGEPIKTAASRFINEIPKKLINLDFKSFDGNHTNVQHDFAISIGNIVEHKLFGKGKVVNIEGEGSNSKITILFFNNERKKLIYKYANLTILKES